MNRLTSFLTGVIVGAVGLWCAMNFHLIRASDGFHLIPKLAPKLEQPYVDVRSFSLQDWQKHQSLAMAIMKANKGDLLKDSTLESFKRSTQGILDQVLGQP